MDEHIPATAGRDTRGGWHGTRTLTAAAVVAALAVACGGPQPGPEAAEVRDPGGRGEEPAWWASLGPVDPEDDDAVANPADQRWSVPADVAFASGSSTVSDRLTAQLRDLGACLADADGRVVVTGHTDSVGTAEDNLVLSRQRAAAVADALMSAGLEAHRITVEGRGQDEPIADELTGDPDEARARNRRVEIAAEANRPCGTATPAPRMRSHRDSIIRRGLGDVTAGASSP
jgi:outer membrane protein OmpA-like peptidoglycan-associated protein